MEKEEKIAERERIAEEMSFFGRLRQYYPVFALFYVSVLRLLVFLICGAKTKACTFIFMTQCLTIVNLPITVLSTFVTQTLVSNFIERGTLWPVSQETLMYHALFCALLGGIAYGLRIALKTKEDDKDPVF